MNDWFEAEQRVERAQELYESGRWEDALRELTEALRVNPDNGEWHFNLGLTLEAMGRNTEAIQAFQRAIDLKVEDVEALNILGVALSRDNRFDEALPCFDRAQQLDPTDPASYANRIALYAQRADREQAELMFYLALGVDEDHDRAYFNMGQCLLDVGEFDKALSCFKKVLHLNRSDDQIHGRLAATHWARGDRERAYRGYIRQLRRQPGDVEALLELGNLLIEMNRPLEAAEKFRRVIELEPTHAQAFSYLGEMALRAGQVDPARHALARAARFDPALFGVRTKLAVIALGAGDAKQARRLLRDEVKLNHADQSPRLRDELGQVLLDAKLPAEAAGVYEQLAGEFADTARYLHQWSTALFEDGALRHGVAVARRAARTQVGYLLPLHNLALASMELGQPRRAMVFVRHALAIDPADRRLRRLRRRVRRALAGRRLRSLLLRGR